MTTLRHARNRTQRVSDAFSSSYYPLFSTLLVSCSYKIMSLETIGLHLSLHLILQQVDQAACPFFTSQTCSYEIMSPETIGLQRHDEAGIVLGKHSGR